MFGNTSSGGGGAVGVGVGAAIVSLIRIVSNSVNSARMERAFIGVILIYRPPFLRQREDSWILWAEPTDSFGGFPPCPPFGLTGCPPSMMVTTTSKSWC